MATIQVASESRVDRRSMLHALATGFVEVMKAPWLLFSNIWNASADAEEIRRYRKYEFREDRFNAKPRQEAQSLGPLL